MMNECGMMNECRMSNAECRSTLSPLQVTKNLASINDIIVLSKDILTIQEAGIVSSEVVYRILGGRMAYDASSGGTNELRGMT
jgi:hypothetical protein